ncbi:schwannomin-interacting protein 1-like [Oncorhynchus keta]|uniref:schwannomin-interacting protein 1-like n=1 Tax=Oncorhynchus keta TaxID=8018 RepID=UPI0015FD8101|nr:schwannomin-interacting protein 1-like [Oncorhynchus keta]XP_052353596.1 schwannomin-interacting protein 1-like [Oncorhynchus keta]XP_052353597.1 schwannomin-interacting protein 1-like [Oncorhynchus keta]
MEGVKEREGERGEEKESDEMEEEEKESEAEEEGDEEEEDDEDAEGAALVWQEGSYGEDDLGLPIMHWEALSLRIAELEKQEEGKREKTKSSSVLDRGKMLSMSLPGERGREKSKDSWEDGGEAEDCNSRVTALTARLSNQMNLQLCFINDSGSEEEEEDSGVTICTKNSKMVVKNGSGVQVSQQPQSPAATKSKSSGFKAALSALKNKLRTEQKRKSLVCGDPLLKNRKRDHSDLQASSLKELNTHRNSLNKAIQDLSTELVVHLQARDQLRTEQDAMLLEVQDMTSL